MFAVRLAKAPYPIQKEEQAEYRHDDRENARQCRMFHSRSLPIE